MSKKAKQKAVVFTTAFNVKILFNGDLCAGFFELGLKGFSFFLGNAGLNHLGSTNNDFLSFAEAEAGNFLNSLDNLELSSFIKGGEFYVEFGLFFFCGSSNCSNACNSYGSSGNAVFFFKSANEVFEFKNRKDCILFAVAS